MRLGEADEEGGGVVVVSGWSGWGLAFGVWGALYPCATTKGWVLKTGMGRTAGGMGVGGCME